MALPSGYFLPNQHELNYYIKNFSLQGTPMKLTKEEVLHVATLARLNIDESLITTFADQLGDILEYVETLDLLDTADVPPTFHAVDKSNAFREDRTTDHLDRESAVSNAPETDDGYFIVPKVLE
jgi:aspartyl-tRNA(Asn)/glutamyl-tRNA(Gln) amidotransferase subunit C